MTIYLIRHGSAGKRNSADSRDGERNLDELGRRQAAAIADLLGSKKITGVLSSPYPRCVQTVKPLAKSLGLKVDRRPGLSEGSMVDEAWDLVTADPAVNVVLCSHGDVIPEIIMRAEARGTDLGKKVGFAKASVWTLRGWNGITFRKATYRKTRTE